MRRLIVPTVLATVLALAAGCATPRPGGSSASQSSSALPPVTTLTVGQIHDRLAQDKAEHKVAVVHFWATWCGPCVEEFPHLAKAYDTQLKSDAKLDFFTVAVDSGSTQDVASFAGSNGATFPVFLAVAPDAGDFQRGMAADWPGVLPTTFVYGPDGRLQLQFRGEIDDLPLFVNQLKSLEGNGT